MALVQCPDCHSEVSDAAPACPRCGRPVALAPLRGTAAAPVVVEQTAKTWKRWQLIGVALVLTSPVACLTGGGIGSSAEAAGGGTSTAGVTLLVIGMLMFFAGVGLFIGARAGAWWHHG